MLNFLLRVLMFMVGLVFAASLAVAVLVLVVVWSVRNAWFRITGRPTSPWVMRFDPRGGFERFRTAGRPAAPGASDIVAARARGEAVDAPVRFDDAGDVSDAKVKPARPE
ncbi:conserved hypothetical protein [Burkholderiales bacterium 8X]|nr:conserved hypothetical protein [Burkholderiales bacterium 8X]